MKRNSLSRIIDDQVGRMKAGAEEIADEISSDVEISELSLAGNGELLHSRVQGRPFHSESGGCALRAADYPVGLFQGAQDVLTLGVFECGNGSRRRRRRWFQLREGELQFSA